MNKKHRRTLEAVFSTPTPVDIRFSAIEALILASGGAVTQRSGSRVAFELKGQIAVFHQPHPKPTMKRASVRGLRRFLEDAGITPRGQ